MKEFITEIDKSYPIPSQIAVMSGNEPIDMRQTCDTVDDFEKFKTETGMELRYSGLITYEKSTKLFKGCIENEDGSFSWIDLNIEKQEEKVEQIVEVKMVEVKETIDQLQDKISSVILEFEENVRLMNLDFNQ